VTYRRADILRVEISICLLTFACAFQLCSATTLPVIDVVVYVMCIVAVLRVDSNSVLLSQSGMSQLSHL